MKKKIWNVIEILKTTEQYLSEKGIENARLNAELLLGETLKMSRVELYMAFERPLNDEELEQYRRQIRRRSRHEPLQYIIGSTEFMGFPFKVNPNVLIPRPETEILVETIVEMKDDIGGGIFLDIGTGSGCIPVSLAKLIPQGRYYGLDISRGAIDTALENARLNNIAAHFSEDASAEIAGKGEIIFFENDILQEVNGLIPENITVMISNPPYITADEMKDLDTEVREYEPHISLTDSGGGLTFYRRLFELAVGGYFKALRYLFLELSGSQSGRIADLAKQYNFNNIDIRKDLSGIDRVLIVRM